MQLWESSSFWTSLVINKKNSQLFNGVGWGGSSKVQVSHLPLFRVWKPNFKPQKKSFGIFDTFSYYLLLTTITINYLFLFYPSSPAFAIFLDTKRKWWCYVQKTIYCNSTQKKAFHPMLSICCLVCVHPSIFYMLEMLKSLVSVCLPAPCSSSFSFEHSTIIQHHPAPELWNPSVHSKSMSSNWWGGGKLFQIFQTNLQI